MPAEKQTRFKPDWSCRRDPDRAWVLLRRLSSIGNWKSAIPPYRLLSSCLVALLPCCLCLRRCHMMTLSKKTVLAKRTHLKPLHEKGKCK